jgi:hypothetical protein
MFPSVTKTSKKRVKTSKNEYYNYCECCYYTASQKSNWDRHLLTKKHIKKASPSVTKSVTKTSKKRVKSYFCEHCGDEYKSRNGLWRHKKKCEYINEPEEEESEEEEEKMPANPGGVFLTTEQLNLILNHKTMGNNNTNCNNTYNNNITVQVFLDDHCKDAKTIEEIGKNLLKGIQSKLTLNDIVYKSNSQFIKDAPSELFIKEMNKMPAQERPVHCADVKRGKFWVNKENEGWVKEDVNEGGTLKQKINDFKFGVWAKGHTELIEKVTKEDRHYSDKEAEIKKKIHHEILEKDTITNNIIAKLATNCNIKDAIKDIMSSE